MITKKTLKEISTRYDALQKELEFSKDQNLIVLKSTNRNHCAKTINETFEFSQKQSIYEFYYKKG